MHINVSLGIIDDVQCYRCKTLAEFVPDVDESRFVMKINNETLAALILRRQGKAPRPRGRCQAWLRFSSTFNDLHLVVVFRVFSFHSTRKL